MSYTPHEWTTGETITAAKLNALENGAAEGGGYDAEISCYLPSGSSAEWEFDIVSGSYTSITALMAEDIAPRILVRIVCEFVPSYWVATDIVAVDYWQTEVSVPSFNMHAIFWTPTDGIDTMNLTWNVDDEVYL